MFTRIYSLAVCFATMMIIAVSGGIALYDVVQATNPMLTMNSWEYQNLQNNTVFRRSGMMVAPGLPAGLAAPTTEQSFDEYTDEELTHMREARLERVIADHRRNAIRSLIQASIFLIIASLMFVIHWRLAKAADRDG